MAIDLLRPRSQPTLANRLVGDCRQQLADKAGFKSGVQWKPGPTRVAIAANGIYVTSVEARAPDATGRLTGVRATCEFTVNSDSTFVSHGAVVDAVHVPSGNACREHEGGRKPSSDEDCRP